LQTTTVRAGIKQTDRLGGCSQSIEESEYNVHWYVARYVRKKRLASNF